MTVRPTPDGRGPRKYTEEAASPTPAEDRFRTHVGSGSNKRLQELKGPFVKDIEGVAHDLASAMVVQTQTLREANGPIPAFQQPLSPERLAALHLPEWFVRGNAHPTSAEAQQYWTDRLGRPNAANPAMAGPRGAHLFQQQMAELWQNPRYRAIAYESMPPALRDQLVQAVQAGTHPGHATVLVDGVATPLPEDGSIDDHLGGR